jgi:hypothetical protein
MSLVATSPKQFLSLSKLAVRLGVTPREVMRIAGEIAVQPAVFLDDAFFYDEVGAARIAEHLKTEKNEG